MSCSRVTRSSSLFSFTDLGTLLRCRLTLGSLAGVLNPVAERRIVDSQLLGHLRDLTA
jgi:hypothetical protein